MVLSFCVSVFLVRIHFCLSSWFLRSRNLKYFLKVVALTEHIDVEAGSIVAGKRHYHRTHEHTKESTIMCVCV